ncbi:hypothetical protein MAR_005641 [Mya arenaria]|uniref:Uncharacterized protein n=1 Tax=Mya arenaria TaxID=6604 RepID=A0ABY7F8C1_MYAAR|nr:hypothetical protein MAR_005641 [Mya arenaria]
MKGIKDNDETRLKRSKKRCKEILVEIEAMKMKMKMTERRSKKMPTGELEVEVAASRLKPDIIAKCDTDTNDCWFTSIKLFSKDKILLADNANFAVKLIDIETHILVDNLRVPEQPWDICLLPSHKAAVSFPTTIQLIGTECELSLLRSIKVKGECYGIDFYNDTFIVSSEEPARIEIINMKGLVLSQIETNALGQHIFKNPHYLTVVSNVQETAIFVSDSGTNNITKLSLNLSVLKTFTTVRQLTEPRGIGLMKGNDLLVCGRGSNSIFQLDTLNDILIEIVGHDEKLQRPFTACYCPRRKKVIYSCYKLFENELNGCVKIL